MMETREKADHGSIAIEQTPDEQFVDEAPQLAVSIDRMEQARTDQLALANEPTVPHDPAVGTCAFCGDHNCSTHTAR